MVIWILTSDIVRKTENATDVLLYYGEERSAYDNWSSLIRTAMSRVVPT